MLFEKKLDLYELKKKPKKNKSKDKKGSIKDHCCLVLISQVVTVTKLFSLMACLVLISQVVTVTQLFSLMACYHIFNKSKMTVPLVEQKLVTFPGQLSSTPFLWSSRFVDLSYFFFFLISFF